MGCRMILSDRNRRETVERGRIPTCAGNRTLIARSFSPYYSHYADWANPDPVFNIRCICDLLHLILNFCLWTTERNAITFVTAGCKEPCNLVTSRPLLRCIISLPSQTCHQQATCSVHYTTPISDLSQAGYFFGALYHFHLKFVTSRPLVRCIRPQAVITV